MKKWLLVVAAVLALAAPALADRKGFRITSFDVELAVQENSDLVVTEHIVVEFLEPRRGIYRTIPVSYTDPRGYLYSLGFQLLDVSDEGGAAHTTKVTRDGKYVKVRIGDANRTVTGRMVYVVRYRVRDAVIHFAEHDELYWNATGHEWMAAIDAASATVRLPGVVAQEEINAAAYTGRLGSRDENATIEVRSGAEIEFNAAGPLEPLHGMTIVAGWPHGVVAFPGPITKAFRFLVDNLIAIAPLLALGFVLRQYWTAGRDPAGPSSVVVRYAPPDDLTPGEIGALVDERVDLRDLTASIVDLAVRGYLRIRVEEQEQFFGLWSKEETLFERTDLSGGLREYEKKLIGGLFTSGAVVSVADLKERFYRRIPGIREALWDGLVERRYVVGDPNTIRKKWQGLGVAAGVATLIAGSFWAFYRGAIFPNAMVVPLLAAAIVALLFVAFSGSMPKRTKKGVQSRAWALGFEEFVDRVEREHLEAQSERNVFEALLPYAMALGVASLWARRFDGIYQSDPPTWFHAHGMNVSSGFSTPGIERSLTTAMGRAGAGMAAAPRSQGSSGFGSSSGGFGGGGFSGGGGGGGGGGSW